MTSCSMLPNTRDGDTSEDDRMRRDSKGLRAQCPALAIVVAVKMMSGCRMRMFCLEVIHIVESERGNVPITLKESPARR